jgi:hypothetical protein
LFFALSYAAALAFQLDRATRIGDFRPVEPAPCHDDGSAGGCDSAFALPSDADVRALLGLPPCWWTATRRDLERIDGLGAIGAAEAWRARAAGAGPTRDQLVAHGVSVRRAAIVARGVAVGCSVASPR